MFAWSYSQPFFDVLYTIYALLMIVFKSNDRHQCIFEFEVFYIINRLWRCLMIAFSVLIIEA